MPRVPDAVDDSVLRVSKLSSFLRMTPRRSSEIVDTSFAILGSRSPPWAAAVRLKPDTTDASSNTSPMQVVSGFSRTRCVVITSP